MKITTAVLGKDEATRQYAERFKRRGKAQRPKRYIGDYNQDWANWYDKRIAATAPDINYKRKPNHGARAQSLEDVFATPHRPKKSKEKVDNVGGIPVASRWGTCNHTLVEWKPFISPKDYTAGREERLKYEAVCHPCVVDHGWAKPKGDRGSRFGFGLVRDGGKKGEHQDILGRVW